MHDMGELLSRTGGLYWEWSEGSPPKILMLGLDGAGKTTCLYKVKLNETENVIPTDGFNVDTVSLGSGLSFTVCDVGYRHKLVPLFRHYYQHTHGLIFVVDSAESRRFAEARCKLFNTVQTRDFPERILILVLANKQDWKGACDVGKLTEELELHSLDHHHPWHIQGTSAVMGDGLYQGLSQLAHMVREYKQER